MGFEVIPAIDLLGGRVVRLEQGCRDRAKVYSEKPAQMARKWERCGARRLHVVDLDGAFDGVPRNLEAIRAICAKTSLEVELGGGLRTEADVQAALDAGVKRIVLGTRAFEDENFLRARVAALGERLIAGVDARGGRVSLRGWVEVAEEKAPDFIRRLAAMGVREVIFTDVATDGMMSGPNIPSLREAAAAAPALNIIASGGVRSTEDLLALAGLGIPNLIGAITGRAIYEGTIDLAEAIEAIAQASPPPPKAAGSAPSP